MKHRLVLLLLLVTSLARSAGAEAVAVKPAATAPPELLPADSRRWTRAGDAVVLADLSRAEPASALITGKREKGKWKLLPFSTADMEGRALSCYSGTGAPKVSVPLAARGWHSIYVGIFPGLDGIQGGKERAEGEAE